MNSGRLQCSTELQLIDQTGGAQSSDRRSTELRQEENRAQTGGAQTGGAQSSDRWSTELKATLGSCVFVM